MGIKKWLAERLHTGKGWAEPGTVLIADEQGKILDAGTHDELLKRCPLYAQMWAAHTQAKDADMREGGGKHVWRI